jgi:integrase
MKFTDNYIKGLKPTLAPYRLNEGGADKGFGIQVNPSGHRNFYVQYSFDKKKRFYALGIYPSISLADAREKCRAARVLLDDGIDPQNQEKSTTGTVAELFAYYIAGMKADGKRTWHDVEVALLTNCSELLNLAASDVTPSHIKKILHTIISRGSLVQANRVRAHLRRAFEVGIFHDNSPFQMNSLTLYNIGSNPVIAVPNNTAAESVGERVLSFEELARLWNYEGDHLPYPQALALKLIIAFGGMRTGEVTGALVEEFDFDTLVWSLPPARHKSGRSTGRWHLLPITELCAFLLRSQMSLYEQAHCLFPNRLDSNRPQSGTALSHAVERFCINEDFPKFTAKDLRRTVKTRMGELGIEKSIRDRIQNHALTDVSSKHYDRWDYMTEKKAALEIWCDCLSSLT